MSFLLPFPTEPKGQTVPNGAVSMACLLRPGQAGALAGFSFWTCKVRPSLASDAQDVCISSAAGAGGGW